jgi:hypothetical protein
MQRYNGAVAFSGTIFTPKFHKNSLVGYKFTGGRGKLADEYTDTVILQG